MLFSEILLLDPPHSWRQNVHTKKIQTTTIPLTPLLTEISIESATTAKNVAELRKYVLHVHLWYCGFGGLSLHRLK